MCGGELPAGANRGHGAATGGPAPKKPKVCEEVLTSRLPTKNRGFHHKKGALPKQAKAKATQDLRSFFSLG
jgi:hypothetical protein